MARRDVRNTTRYWHHPRFPGLSLLRAELTTYHYAPHLHDTYVIAATEAGGSLVTCLGKRGDIQPSTTFLSNPLEPQSASMRHNAGWRYRALYLSESAARDIATALGLDHLPYFVTAFCPDETIARAILTLHRALESSGDDWHETHLRLLDTMGALLEPYSTARRSDIPQATTPAARQDVVRRVIAMMRDRYADPLRLDDLSHPVGMSPFQLITLFKRTVGMTPHTYLTQIRLREAQRYLRSGQPIAYVAAASGFYDQSAFTRHFKRSYGITPLQFAIAARNSS